MIHAVVATGSVEAQLPIDQAQGSIGNGAAIKREHRQPVAQVNVGVVGKDQAADTRFDFIFTDDKAVAGRNRRVIDTGDGDIGSANTLQAEFVTDRVGDRVNGTAALG